MRVGIETLQQHIEQLCLTHNISIGTHSHGGRAFRKKRQINIQPVKSAVTYAVALHEIGHIHGPWQSGTRLEREAGAWHWARNNALFWTGSMEKKLLKSLGSYIQWAKRHKTAKYPSPMHPFWDIAGISPTVTPANKRRAS